MLTDSNFEMVFGFRSIGFRVYTKKILDYGLRTVGMSSNYYNRY